MHAIPALFETAAHSVQARLRPTEENPNQPSKQSLHPELTDIEGQIVNAAFK
jgi:hypothetical protein